MSYVFRNLRPELADTGELMGAEWTDVTIEGTMILAYHEFARWAPNRLFREVKAEALRQVQAIFEKEATFSASLRN